MEKLRVDPGQREQAEYDHEDHDQVGGNGILGKPGNQAIHGIPACPSICGETSMPGAASGIRLVTMMVPGSTLASTRIVLLFTRERNFASIRKPN